MVHFFNFFRSNAKKAGILFLSLILAIALVSLIDKQIDKQIPGQIAGVSIEEASKFLNAFIQFDVSPVSADVTGPYQNVNSDVNISGNLTQSGGYAYLGNFNSDAIYPRAGNDLAIAWNFVGGSREIGLWNTDVLAGTSFVFRQLTGAGSKTDLMTILANGSVGIGTASPGYKLEVEGNGSTASTEYLLGGFDQVTSAGGAYLGYYVGSGGSVQEGRVRAGGNIPLALGTTAFPQAIYVLNTNGSVGIGTANPADKLDVAGSARIAGNVVPSADNTYSMGVSGTKWNSVYTTNILLGPGGGGTIQFANSVNVYQPILYRYGSDISLQTFSNDNTFRIRQNNGTVRFRFDTGTGAAYTSGGGWQGSGADVAEYYPSEEQLIEGVVVTIASKQKKINPYSNTTTLIKTAQKGDVVLGIISTAPTVKMGVPLDSDLNEHLENMSIVALAGRVPAIVSTQDGLISAGDYLGISNLSGIASKLNHAGQSLAIALEPLSANCQTVTSLESIAWPEDDGTNPEKPCFSLPDGTYVGKIMVFVNVSWYDPDANLASTQGFHLDLNQLRDAGNNLITRIGAFAEIIVGKVQAGVIETQKLVVNGVDILEKINQQEQTIKQQAEEIKLLQEEVNALKSAR